jgi:hypothetical protein
MIPKITLVCVVARIDEAIRYMKESRPNPVSSDRVTSQNCSSVSGFWLGHSAACARDAALSFPLVELKEGLILT